jgi:hypothetical protein
VIVLLFSSFHSSFPSMSDHPRPRCIIVGTSFRAVEVLPPYNPISEEKTATQTAETKSHDRWRSATPTAPLTEHLYLQSHVNVRSNVHCVRRKLHGMPGNNISFNTPSCV